MNADILKAIAELAWPVLAAIILIALLPTIIRVARSRAFTVKYGDMEISVQDASDQVRKQIEDLQNLVRELQESRVTATKAAPSASKAAVEGGKRTILWVDDDPQNNAYEIAKLQGDGWDVSSAESTTAALMLLQNTSSPPTLVISDMGRREGLTYRKTAGLDLIRELRARQISVPVIIYSSASVARDYGAQVQGVGGNGITASPINLFSMVEQYAAQQDLRSGAQ